jgi:hypothetical protein
LGLALCGLNGPPVNQNEPGCIFFPPSRAGGGVFNDHTRKGIRFVRDYKLSHSIIVFYQEERPWMRNMLTK